MTDQGPQPFVVDIEKATVNNPHFRNTLWTGSFLQLTVMTISPGEDIGAEIHEDHDQFLRIEEGKVQVMIGAAENDLVVDEVVEDDWAVFIPAGSWHNVVNTGNEPLKLYSIYAAPEHPHGTVHATKAEADAAEHDH